MFGNAYTLVALLSLRRHMLFETEAIAERLLHHRALAHWATSAIAGEMSQSPRSDARRPFSTRSAQSSRSKGCSRSLQAWNPDAIKHAFCLSHRIIGIPGEPRNVHKGPNRAIRCNHCRILPDEPRTQARLRWPNRGVARLPFFCAPVQPVWVWWRPRISAVSVPRDQRHPDRAEQL